MNEDMGPSSMNLIFASNLRRLVESRGTVSAVALLIGINRQQLTKYLSGKAIPQKITRKRLAEFFSIDEGYLFSRNNQPAYDQKFDDQGNSTSLIEHPQFTTMLGTVESVIYQSLVPGYYHTYLLSEADEGVIIRSLTIVSGYSRFQIFRRITGIREPQRSRWVISKGNHLGVVLERANNIYFVGIDIGGSSTPTLLAVRWAASDKPLLAGNGLVLARNGPANCSVVMEQLSQSIQLPHAIRRCHTIYVDDVDLDPRIRALLLEPHS